MDISRIESKLHEHKNNLAIGGDDKAHTHQDLLDALLNGRMALRNCQINSGSVVTVVGDFSIHSIATILCLIEIDCVIVPMIVNEKLFDEKNLIAQSDYILQFKGDSFNFIELPKKSEKHDLIKNLQSLKNPGLILFSSGTTGKPKAAVHDLSRLMKKYKKETKNPGRMISFLMFDHIGGFNTIMHGIFSGGLVVTIKNRDVDTVCRAIEKYSVEVLPTSPTFLNLLIINDAFNKYNLSSLKTITYGTEPMPETTLRTLSKLCPNVTLKQTYGLSELGILSTKSESNDSLWVKLGGEGYETKVIDDILFIKAKSAMLGYLNAESPFDSDGWFNTKDKVEVRDGYFRILGRTTDLINVGGEKVYPIEIESMILSIPGVLDCTVKSEPNALIGNTVVATVQVEERNNNREFMLSIKSYCARNLARFKIPSKISLTTHVLFSERQKRTRVAP